VRSESLQPTVSLGGLTPSRQGQPPRLSHLGMSDELTAALNTPEVSRYALRTEALAGYWKA
jgi:hypothetical protein